MLIHRLSLRSLETISKLSEVLDHKDLTWLLESLENEDDPNSVLMKFEYIIYISKNKK
jgi:hypothetical protein